MSVNNYTDLVRHAYHEIECVTYGENNENVAVECVECSEVLIDYDADTSKA